MSYVPQPSEQPFPPAEKKGMSGCGKAALGCGLSFFVLCLLCAGGAYYMFSGFSKDPTH